VLGSLLPGIREIRAPLAAGYTWLLVAWLAYGSDASRHPTGVAADIKRLHDVVSAAGAAVAVGFVAYVVGIFSIGATHLVARRMRALYNRLRKGRSPHWPLAAYSLKTSLSLDTTIRPLVDKVRVSASQAPQPIHVGAIVDEAAERRRRPGETDIDVLRFAVAEDFDQIGRRLIGREPELFGEYDRLRAEAELRLSLILPGVALGATLCAVGGSRAWVALGVAVVVLSTLLVFLATARNHDSTEVLASALRDERVEAPVLVRFEQTATRMIEAAGADPSSATSSA